MMSNRKTERALGQLMERQAEMERESAIRKLQEVQRRVNEALDAIADNMQPFRMIGSSNMGIADASAEAEARVHAWLLIESQKAALNNWNTRDDLRSLAKEGAEPR